MTIPDMVAKPPPSRIRAQIDENLKRIYDDITKEEVPERFRVLLDHLRAKTAERPTADPAATSPATLSTAPPVTDPVTDPVADPVTDPVACRPGGEGGAQ